MDEREFERIFRETKRIVLSAIEKNLVPRFGHAASDVVQETYLRAFRGLEKNRFEGHASIGTWLYVIARNESLRMNERLSREEKKFEMSVREGVHQRTEAPPSLPDENIPWLHELIGNLPDRYRTVMDLVSMGYSEKKISQALSIPRGTVKSRAAKGRELLRKLWKGGDLNEG